MQNKNEITKLLNKINTRYKTDLKLKTVNIITASRIFNIDEDETLSMMDICPEHDTYIFDAEEIIPILKNKIEKSESAWAWPKGTDLESVNRRIF